MKTKLCVLAVVALVIWGMKRHYADARADDLQWILSPTTQVVGVMTGTTFAWQPEEGYFSRERMFLIEKSCAGINFMIAAFGLVVFALFHRVGSGVSGVYVLGAGLVASYAAAVVVNAVRITIALWLGDHPLTLPTLTAADMHRLEGIVVYFGGLLLLYQLVQRLDRTEVGNVFHRTVLPLAVYYAVTLAIPLANGAAQSSGFVKHALVVLVIPPVAILVACVASAVASPIKRRYCRRRLPRKLVKQDEQGAKETSCVSRSPALACSSLPPARMPRHDLARRLQTHTTPITRVTSQSCGNTEAPWSRTRRSRRY